MGEWGYQNVCNKDFFNRAVGAVAKDIAIDA